MSDEITQRTTTVVTRFGTLAGTTKAKPDEWEYVEVHFLRFERLSPFDDAMFESPRFTCLGRKWTLDLYPGGCLIADDGYVSIFLTHQSTGSIDLEYKIRVQNGDGEQIACHHQEGKFESVDDADLETNCGGTSDFAKRSQISQALVKGTLIVEVRMRVIGARDTPEPPFVPDNPLCQNVLKRFNDEETADVLLEVSDCENELGEGARKKAKISPIQRGADDASEGGAKKKSRGEATQFYAHRFILRDAASTLAELAKSAKGMSPIQITGVKPEIFHHMLRYAYGGEVPEEEMTANAKDLIDAADKFGVVSLKLKAEACYAKSVELTVDNVLDNLLYADSKNCALLKEVVVDFVAENGKDILGKVSFNDVPGSVVTDLLTTVTRGKKKAEDSDDYDTMRVSTLRRKLHEKGLDIDGSREAMIALLKEHS